MTDHILGSTEDTEEDTVLRVAWAQYGRDMQIDICIEEMAELTHALITARRDGLEWTQGIVEELADLPDIERAEIRGILNAAEEIGRGSDGRT